MSIVWEAGPSGARLTAELFVGHDGDGEGLREPLATEGAQQVWYESIRYTRYLESIALGSA